MLTTNDKWNYIKNGLLSLIDEIAPEQNITIISGEQFPWIDDDLRYIQHLRDENFKKWFEIVYLVMFAIRNRHKHEKRKRAKEYAKLFKE